MGEHDGVFLPTDEIRETFARVAPFFREWGEPIRFRGIGSDRTGVPLRLRSATGKLFELVRTVDWEISETPVTFVEDGAFSGQAKGETRTPRDFRVIAPGGMKKLAPRNLLMVQPLRPYEGKPGQIVRP
jgi:hypothetical protein